MESELRNAVIAGIGFVTVCIFILVIPALNTLVPSLWVKFFVLISSLVLYAATLIVHLYGYVIIGRKHDSRLLSISALTLMFGFALFGLVVILSVFANVWLSALEVTVMNTLIGLTITVLGILALPFAVALIRMYRQFGFVTIIAACAPPIAVIFIWTPWLPMLFVALSSYLLSRVGSQGAFHESSKVFGIRQ